MHINGETPRELQFIQRLRQHFSQSWTKRIKKKVLQRDETYTKSELAGVLHHKKSDYAYQFLDKLIQENVLEHAGKRETGSSPVDIYRYRGNKELLKAFSNTEYYQENRELFVNTLEKGEGKELI